MATRAPARIAMAAALPAEPDVVETATFVAARKAYLDALPVAAAVISIKGGGLHATAANDLFERLDHADERIGLFERLRADTRCRGVLSGKRTSERFEWRDGDLVTGRHFTVSISRLGFASTTEPRALLTLIDRTAEVQTAESLRRQLLCDPLTGLTNRTGFVEALDLRIAADGPDALGVVILDLSRFSRVNECIGTLGGDELIVTVARRLVGILRGYDLLGRTGANEFALAVRVEGGESDLLAVAQRAQATLSTPFRLSDFEIKIDCAIGCALGSEGGNDAERLIRHAQLALKSSKASSRIEVYQVAALDAARRRFVIETELRRAIEREELTLAFQPLVSMTTGHVSGFEALARWVHPDRGEVPPSEFIRVAEDSGLIVPLGRWAIERALATLNAWDRAYTSAMPLYFGVNLSPLQITRDDVPAFIERALGDHGIHGSRLTIELTESAIVSDPDRTGRTLDALKVAGAMVAMDDFGTGYSNLAALQRLPIDMLKMDRSFVTDMLEDRDKAAIVRAILSLAAALGMTTTAEGVEAAAVAKTLAALGCTTGQGWHYSPALDADKAYAFACGSLAAD